MRPPDAVGRDEGLAARALRVAVHRHGLVHGDVKAENVMREVSGRIVLMDFGAAREFEATDANVISGTVRYLAPEVLRGAAPEGAVYARDVMGRADPMVGLLNIGEEQEKGNASVKEAHNLLMAHSTAFRFGLRQQGPTRT